MSRMPDFWQRWPVSLRWAIAFSVALHLFVIFPMVFWLYTPIAMPQAPLSAVLRGPGESTQTAHDDSRQIAPLSAGETRKPTPKTPRVPLIQTKHAERAAETVPPLRPTSVGVAQGDAAAAPNVSAKVGSIGGAPELARDGADADALQRYRLALGVEARRARRYPEVSRARGQEGVCETVVILSKAGGVPTVIPGRSSGSQTLDDAALAMTRLAAERTPVPTELQGRHLRIPLRIRFSLDDF